MNAHGFILFAAAVALRVGAGWYLSHFTNPEPWEYEEVANNLLAGKGFIYQHFGVAYHAYIAPIYPLVCAAVYSVTDHSHTILLLLQCLVSAGSCLLVRSLGQLTFKDPRSADCGAWLLAFHPGLIVYASRLHPLTLDVFSFLWVLWAWIYFVRRPSGGTAIYAGVSGGIAMLSRGTIALFLLVAIGCFYRYARLPWKETFRHLVVASGVVVIVMLPWLARNAIYFHSFPVLQTNEGFTFWLGNNPFTLGGTTLPDGRAVIDVAPEEFRAQLFQLDEAGQNKYLRDAAWRYIWEHPARARDLYITKFGSFWWFSPQTGVHYPPQFLLGYRLYYIPIAILAIVGFWRSGKALRDVEGILLLSLMLSIAVIQSFFYVEGRHRWAVEPLLLLMSGAGVASIFSRILPSHYCKAPTRF